MAMTVDEICGGSTLDVDRTVDNTVDVAASSAGRTIPRVNTHVPRHLLRRADSRVILVTYRSIRN
ncbi:hypothetical protein ACFFX0_13615 [Citricoccus parietis]|uniref:Uncharacterized protein n=1 Tax=Citricoccus parietis TaxID=592307 RepID=A0ABV5G0I3_9MICC